MQADTINVIDDLCRAHTVVAKSISAGRGIDTDGDVSGLGSHAGDRGDVAGCPGRVSNSRGCWFAALTPLMRVIISADSL